MVLKISIRRIRYLPDFSKVKYVGLRLLLLSLMLMSEIEKLFVVSGLVISCHIVVGLFLIFIHVRPFGTHVLHYFVR